MADQLLDNFLQSLPPDVSAEARAIPGAVVILDDAATHFRQDPVAGLSAMSARLTSALESAPAAVIWCYRGDAGYGLEDFELAAILGRRLSLRRVTQVNLLSERHVLI